MFNNDHFNENTVLWLPQIYGLSYFHAFYHSYACDIYYKILKNILYFELPSMTLRMCVYELLLLW